MKTPKNAKGRPPKKRLGAELGGRFREFLTQTLSKRKLSWKELHVGLSEELQEGFGIGNSRRTIERTLLKVYSGGSLCLPYVEGIEKFLNAEVPKEIRTAVHGLSTMNFSDKEDHLDHGEMPINRFIANLPTEAQRTAAKEQFEAHSKVLREIESGKISLPIETAEYFSRFFKFLRADKTRKNVRVFARLINLVARKNLLMSGPKEFFPECRKLVEAELLDVEYVIFFYGRNELQIPEVCAILEEYSSFASAVRLHFATETDLDEAEIAHTIALWGSSQAFTHGWDYRGRISNVTQWVLERDQNTLKDLYEKIKAHSELYHPKPKAK